MSAFQLSTLQSGIVGQQDASITSRLSISLQNPSCSSTINAYVTGKAVSNGSKYFFLLSDGLTPYYPPNPGGASSLITANCAIHIAPGCTTNIVIPYLDGGRIWFCMDNTLTFRVNRSESGTPAIVEPSAVNSADPNYRLSWGFCELSYNSMGLYANISYVDFVGLPISLTATSTSADPPQHVSGILSNGLENICNDLKSQNDIDGAGWDKLVVTDNHKYLRALAPSSGIAIDPSMFQTYWSSYIDAVWSQHLSQPLTVDTQSSTGVVTGHTSNDGSAIIFDGLGSFTKPTALDIFGANTGPFTASNTDAMKSIGARINAAINRTTLSLNRHHPWGGVGDFYQNTVTNHYARVVHAANIDGKGYAFPYDDVTSSGSVDASGFVRQSSPSNLLVVIGGMMQSSKSIKRSVGWDCDIKMHPEEIEKILGMAHPKLLNEPFSPTTNLVLPSYLERFLAPAFHVKYHLKLPQTMLSPLENPIPAFLHEICPSHARTLTAVVRFHPSSFLSRDPVTYSFSLLHFYLVFLRTDDF